MCYNVPFMFLSFFLAPFVLSLSLIQNGDSANGEHALKSRGSTVVRYSSRVYAREDNALPFPSSSLNKKYSAVQINQSKVARARVLGHATIDHVYLDGRVLRKVQISSRPLYFAQWARCPRENGGFATQKWDDRALPWAAQSIEIVKVNSSANLSKTYINVKSPIL